MAQKFNSEFNYRYQVIGCTPWEKIKTLKGFLEGRLRAAAQEEAGKLKYQAKLAKLKHLQNSGNGLEHEILELKAEIIETESFHETLKEGYELNHAEIKMLKKLLKELYVLAEPTRIEGYTDEQMFEANAANEFTVDMGREIQAEMIANGRPSPARIRNAMSNPHTWNALKQIGLIPKKTKILDVITLAQTPSCNAFLYLAKDTQDAQDGLTLLDSVPSGFDFTYCQEWGLTVDDDVVDRVILDLRKKAYPSWEDQLDYIYHNGVEDWKTNIITPIKEKYPKR